jgi:hypothetical protein
MVRALWLLSVFFFVACGGDSGGSSGTGGAGGGTGATGGSGGSGAGGGTGASGGSSGTAGTDGGSFACGSATCSDDQLCVHPCCGGAPPKCEPKPEGGTCPAGTHEGCSYGCSEPGGCCEPDPCTPPPPYCVDPGTQPCVPQGHDCYLACA